MLEVTSMDDGRPADDAGGDDPTGTGSDYAEFRQEFAVSFSSLVPTGTQANLSSVALLSHRERGEESHCRSGRINPFVCRRSGAAQYSAATHRRVKRLTLNGIAR